MRMEPNSSGARQDGGDEPDKGCKEAVNLPGLIQEAPGVAAILDEPRPELAELSPPNPLKSVEEGLRLLTLLSTGGVAAWNQRRKEHPPSEWLSPLESPLHADNILGEDIPGPLITDKDLSGIDLRGADLRQITFVKVDLRSANMRTAKLCSACFWMSDLTNADLAGADLRRSRILRTNLSDADLVRSRCQAAVMWHGTRLKDANLQGAKFRYALLDREALESAIWDEADIDEAFFTLWELSQWHEARKKR